MAISVHDPRGYPPKVEGRSLAPRLDTLDGKVLYLVIAPFDNTDAFMERLAGWFAEHRPEVETRIVATEAFGQDSPALRAEIEASGDAAVVGLGL
ncbi:UGSC family (seleno)protein [Actinomadura chibensis]|uniref:UGSC-like domain-containing protein n=1 Tax=Actinomadura chibensis TaxID=392828 RepID=A0A5D0NDF6_9ACTN|nr:hypothetical protein [Actinomadura chibensis]TYB42470.1 hypothetical protein FXF69_32215 [Actinomadura chibensis]